MFDWRVRTYFPFRSPPKSMEGELCEGEQMAHLSSGGGITDPEFASEKNRDLRDLRDTHWKMNVSLRIKYFRENHNDILIFLYSLLMLLHVWLECKIREHSFRRMSILNEDICLKYPALGTSLCWPSFSTPCPLDSGRLSYLMLGVESVAQAWPFSAWKPLNSSDGFKDGKEWIQGMFRSS